MAKLSDEEIAILQKAKMIKDRMEAERLEAEGETAEKQNAINSKNNVKQNNSRTGNMPNGQGGQRPVNPAGQRPVNPAGQRVNGQGGQRPVNPAGQRPVNPAGQRVNGQGSQRPVNPAGQRVNGQGGQRPVNPAGQRPVNPAGQRVNGQGSQRPVNPAGQRVNGQGGQRPVNPAGQRPNGQGGQRPVNPAGQRPNGQGGQRPVNPAGQRPNGQGGQRPVNPAGQRPNGQGNQRPVNPAGQRPNGQTGFQPDDRGRKNPVNGNSQQKFDRKMPVKRKTPIWKKVIISILIVLLILIVIGVILFFFTRANISKTNYVADKTTYTRAADVVTDKNVKNILLLGTDERAGVDTSRSDAIILASINTKQKKIIVTSFLRDSYVTIPGYGQNRINHAYQMGGAPLVAQTIEENFKIGINSYAQVDFYSFMDIIDVLGGVEITVMEDELIYVNGYISEVNHIIGAPEGDQFLTAAGTQMLNGRQALAYSRIRYIGTDFARTERQRTVLQGLFQRAKSASAVRLYQAASSCLSDITTNIDDNRMTLLLFQALFYTKYDIVQNRVPMDGTWRDENANGQEVLGIDFPANIAGLRSSIYGT